MTYAAYTEMVQKNIMCECGGEQMIKLVDSRRSRVRNAPLTILPTSLLKSYTYTTKVFF